MDGSVLTVHSGGLLSPDAVLGDLWFRPYRAGDMLKVDVQAAQADIAPQLAELAPDLEPAVIESGMAWTGLYQGQIVGCAGIQPIWPGRANAWALIGPVPRHCWVKVTLKVRAEIAAAHAKGWRRIEATPADAFPAGRRWVELLGFERLCRLEAYDPFGNDHWLYAHVAKESTLCRS
jgi:hypothetical protein